MKLSLRFHFRRIFVPSERFKYLSSTSFYSSVRIVSKHYHVFSTHSSRIQVFACRHHPGTIQDLNSLHLHYCFTYQV